MAARVLRDAQDVTTVETTTKPIEVRLSRPHLEVTCRIVFSDGTAIAVGVDALSFRGAQHEMTAWLIEQGYEPAGCWSSQDENGRQAARTFHPGPQPYAVETVTWRPPAVAALRHEPDLDPPRRPARRMAPRTRRAAAPQSRASRGPAGSPQAVETELRAWARANSRRDDAIREAIAAGVSVHRIQEVTGIARTTIMRILGSPSRAPRRSP